MTILKKWTNLKLAENKLRIYMQIADEKPDISFQLCLQYLANIVNGYN